MEKLSTRDRRLARKKKLEEIKARKQAETVESIKLHFQGLFETYKKDFEEKEEKRRKKVVGVGGHRGESAFEVAVRNGFVGTESAWLLSLRGDSGVPEFLIDGGLSDTDYTELTTIDGGSS